MLKLLTEYEECVVFSEWLSWKGIKHTHIPNETFTKNWGTKIKNKKQGVSRGVPDYMCVVGSNLVFIEMKRKKRGVVSDEQKEWLSELNKCTGVSAHIAKGADEAIKIIESI